LKNSKILLGITGGIAIYKAAELLRRLTTDYNAEVRVVMTAAAKKFMSPLIFETLSGQKVYSEMFQGEYVGTRHIDLVKEADLIVICPATANIIAKAVHGIGDDLLSTIIMAGWQKTVFAPAMNVKMWENPATQSNLQKISAMGMDYISPDKGLLACNDVGTGKLAAVSEICEFIEMKLNRHRLLANKKVVITAGPTREKIDTVRFISNYSTGKMGLALAKAAYYQGAEVTLITGPVNLDLPDYLNVYKVETAAELLETLENVEVNIDYLYMAAAVEDFVPVDFEDIKIKKSRMPDAIKVKQAPDILSHFRKSHKHTTTVGFSVETNRGKENSLSKMKAKELDYIIWNNPKVAGAAFGHDTNEVTIFANTGEEWHLPKNTKLQIAHQIIKITTQNRG